MRCFALAMRWAIVASAHQERARDLGRGQAADRPQRQRDRRGRRQRRMAAHEQHDQRVVLVGDLARGGSCSAARLSRSLRDRSLRQLVDQPPLGGLDQPAARLRPERRPAASARRPRAAPPGRRPRRRRSRRTGGRARRGPAAPARAAGPRHRTGTFSARHPPCCRYASISATSDGAWSITCRTWIGCCSATPSGPGTAEILAAISIARASDSTSTIW